MKKTIILFFVLVLAYTIDAQNPINYYQHLPNGYKLKDSNNELGPSVEGDFDKDGINDLAIILFTSKDATPVFGYFLSSKFTATKTFKFCEWTFMMHEMSYENGIISLSSNNGSMPIYGSMNLKYDAVKKDIIITKYEDSIGGKSAKFKTIIVN